MSGVNRKLKRQNIRKERKAARQEYLSQRELGKCYLHDKGCQNNGDFKEACKLCDFVVQSCTLHHPMGRQKARQHLFLKHPAKTIPMAILDTLRGRSLE